MQICFRFGLLICESEISVTLKHLLKYYNGYDPHPPPHICGYSNHFQIPLPHIGDADVRFYAKIAEL